MMKRILLLFLLSSTFAVAQLRPVAGTSCDVTYHPDPGSPLAGAHSLTLVYAFDAWGMRYGTRLALLENVLRPDSARVHRVAMTKAGSGWNASVPIPRYAAVLSYYVTDGVSRDDNHERTYTAYVYDSTGVPVRNAHFYMVNFLELARAPIDDRLRESEDEVRQHPKNFPAYSQFFSLLFEREKGSETARKKIVERLDALQKEYRDSVDVLNLAARTYAYILRDPQTAISYKNRVPVNRLWPDVFMIFDRDKSAEEERQRAIDKERRRAALIDAPVPDVECMDTSRQRVPLKSLAGKAVLLTFWATTSEKSKELLASLSDVQMEFGGRDLTVLAVDVDPNIRIADEFIDKTRFPLRFCYPLGALLYDLGIDGIPTTILLDKRGTVRSVFLGFEDGTLDRIRSAVRAAL